VVGFLDESRRSGYHAIGQSSTSIRSCFARLGRHRNKWVLHAVLSPVGRMVVVVMRGCHEGNCRLLGHRNLARSVDRRVCLAWMVGSAPIPDLFLFHGGRNTPVATSPAKAAEEAEREGCKE